MSKALAESQFKGDQEKVFIDLFGNACVEIANEEYFDAYNKYPKPTGEEDPHFNTFLQSRISVYQRALEIGKSCLDNRFTNDPEVTLQDPKDGVFKTYKYDPVSRGVVLVNEAVSKQGNSFIDFTLNFGEESASDNSDNGDFRRSENDEINFYSDYTLMHQMLSKGMEELGAQYTFFEAALNKFKRFDSTGWATLKNTPPIDINLKRAKNYLAILDKMPSNVEKSSWFVNQRVLDPSLENWSDRSNQLLEEAEILEGFFNSGPEYKTVRTLNSENSFAVALIGERYTPSSFPQIYIDDVIAISRIIYDLAISIPDPIDRESALTNVTSEIFIKRSSQLVSLLESRGMPVELGLNYFRQILQKYIMRLPEQYCVDFFEGREVEFTMRNLLYGRYNTVHDERENSERHLASFLQQYKQGKYKSDSLESLEPGTVKEVYAKLVTGKLEGFDSESTRNALIATLRYFQIDYEDSLQVFVPTEGSVTCRTFFGSIKDNLKQLSPVVIEVFSEIYAYKSLVNELNELGKAGQIKADALLVGRIKNKYSGENVSDFRSGDKLYLDLDVFVECHLPQIARNIKSVIEQVSYYSQPLSSENIILSVKKWVKERPELVSPACAAFGLSPLQLEQYIAAKVTFITVKSKRYFASNPNFMLVTLENSWAENLAEQESKKKVEKLVNKGFTWQEFSALPVIVQNRLVDAVFEMPDTKEKQELLLDIFYYLRLKYSMRGPLKLFDVTKQKSEEPLVKIKRIQAVSHFSVRAIQGLSSESVLADYLDTVLLRDRLFSTIDSGIPKPFTGQLGKELRQEFFTYYFAKHGTRKGSVIPKTLYSKDTISLMARDFVQENLSIVEEKMERRNVKIRRAENHYDLDRFTNELVEYAEDAFERTRRLLYGNGYVVERGLTSKVVIQTLTSLLEASLERI